MPPDEHGERIARLEAKGDAEKDRLDRLVEAVDRYVEEGERSRAEHSRQHEVERGQHSADHGRIHARIDDLPTAIAKAVEPIAKDTEKALSVAQGAAQAVHDAGIFLKGGKAALVGVGVALFWIAQKAWEWWQASPRPHAGP